MGNDGCGLKQLSCCLAHSHYILNISMSSICATVLCATTACSSPSNPTDGSYSEGKTMIIFWAMKRLEINLGTGRIDKYNMNSIPMHHISNTTLCSLFHGVLCTLGCDPYIHIWTVYSCLTYGYGWSSTICTSDTVSPMLYYDQYGGQELYYGPVHMPCTGDGGWPY